MNRASLVEYARQSIALGSKSFAAASRLFDRETRERAWLLYGWCRRCDDIADGQEMGGALSTVDDAQARLMEMRAKTKAALDGVATGDPAFDGLAVVAAETGIPHRFANDLIDGFALDTAGWRPETSDDLLRYCYHVAGAVGCMMAVIMGVRPDDEAVLDRACDLGLAFQIANIARDISEDAEGGRCYIPAQWLSDAGIDATTLMASGNRAALATVGQRLAHMAQDYESSARHGSSALSYRSAWAVLSAAGIYGGIARKVVRRGKKAWDRRIYTSKAEKLAWVVQAGAQTALRGRLWPASHNRPPHLWERPR